MKWSVFWIPWKALYKLKALLLQIKSIIFIIIRIIIIFIIIFIIIYVQRLSVDINKPCTALTLYYTLFTFLFVSLFKFLNVICPAILFYWIFLFFIKMCYCFK